MRIRLKEIRKAQKRKAEAYKLRQVAAGTVRKPRAPRKAEA